MLDFKRIMSMVLVLAMLAGMMPPARAAAEEAETLPVETAVAETTAPIEPTSEETEAPAEETAEPLAEETIPSVTEEAAYAVYSGSCGDALTWELDTTTGVLHISGTGPMTGWTDYNGVPWYNNAPYIKSVVIDEGVTTIGINAFYFCGSLNSVTLPDSITEIGKAAFYQCRLLTEIDLPSNLKTIGEYAFSHCIYLEEMNLPAGVVSIDSGAFRYCDSLKEVTIPDSVVSLGDDVFYGCENLTSVTLGSGLTSLGSYVFEECAYLTEILVSEENTAFSSLDGVLYNKNKTLLVRAPMALTGTCTVVPGTVTIGDRAFVSCKGLTAIELPDTVRTIGAGAFASCTGLTELSLNGNIQSIGDSAFNGCEALTSAHIGNSVASVGRWVFKGCISLRAVYLAEGISTISADFYEYSPFYGCSSTLIVYCGAASRPTDWGTYWAYYSNKNILNVSWGVPESEADFWLKEAQGTDVVIPDTITRIPNYAFSNRGHLKTVSIPDSVTDIGTGAFMYCTALTSVTIPSGVKRIEEWAFYDCAGLTEIRFQGDAPAFVNGAFYNTAATVYYPADNATWTEEVRQNYGGTLTWVADCMGNHTPETIPAVSPTCTEPGLSEGSKCSACGEILTAQTEIDARGHVFYESDGVCRRCGEYSTCGENVKWKIENGVLRIFGTGPMADYSGNGSRPWDAYAASSFTSAVVEEGVTTLGKYALYGFSKLKSVTLADSVTSIGSDAMGYCSALTSITLPANLTSIGARAFSGSTKFTSMDFPATLTYIGSWAFNNCDGLLEMTFRGDAPNFHSESFLLAGTYHRIQAYYPAANPTWTEDVLQQYGGNIAWIPNCPDGHTVVTDPAVTPTCTESGLTEGSHCSVCNMVLTEQSYVSPNGHSFADGLCSVCGARNGTCGTSASWVLCDGVLQIFGTSMPSWTSQTEVPWYQWRKEITSAVIDEDISTVAAYAFYDCTNLQSVSLPTEVARIGNYAFYGCTALKGITFDNDRVRGIGDYAFSGCTALSSVYFYDEIQSIGSYAFNGCTALKSISLNSSLTSIGMSAFRNSGLTRITIPGNVTTIAANTFYGCSNLASVTIGSGVSTISSDAFSRCASLTTVTIPASVTSLSQSAFDDCTALTGIWVDTANANYSSAGGVLMDKIGISVIRMPEGYTGAFDIPETVEEIDSFAFYHCAGLTSVTVPENVYEIGSSAFEGCTGLTAAELRTGSNLGIADAIFSDCTALKEVTFTGDAPYYIAPDAFEGVTATVHYPPGNTTWTAEKKQNYGGTLTWVTECNGDTHIPEVIPAVAPTCTSTGLTEGSKCADCGEILTPQEIVPASHTIANDICTLCGKAGICGTNLTWTLEDGTLTISGTGPMKDYNNPSSIQRPWYNVKNSITKVIVEDGVTTIGDAAFFQLVNMAEISIGKDVYLIGYRSFQECVALKNLTLPDNLTTIEEQAFWNCSGLRALYIPSTVVTIKASAPTDSPFYNCNSGLNLFCEAAKKPDKWDTYWCYYKTDYYTLKPSWNVPKEQRLFWTVDAQKEEVVIPDYITTIPKNAFFGNTKLTTVTIPATVTAIGEGAFAECTNLAVVNISDLAAWCGIAFADRDANPIVRSKSLRMNGRIIQDLVIPEGVTAIGQYTFPYNYTLTGITIPDSVTSIGKCAFMDCEGVRKVTIGKGVTTVEYFAFVRCDGLEEVIFTGNAPTFVSGAFDSTTATVYYPAGNATWTSDVMKDYGGTLTWVAACTAGHTPSVIPGKNATCTATGLTEGSKCLYCGELLAAQTTIPVLGHNMGTWQTTLPATCTEEGQQRRDCSRCDYFETKVLPVVDHTPEVIPAVAATCTTTGLTRGSKCSVCGEILVAQTEIPALDHALGEWQTTAEPSCTAEGQQRRDCSRCDYFETEVLPVADHTPEVIPAVEATCTATGLTQGSKCSACGEILTAQTEIPALDHDLGDWQTTTEPSCTAEGQQRRDCSRCDHFETEALPVVEHTPEVIPSVEPTCTATGLTAGSKCSACGGILAAQEEIPALDHDLGDWQTTLAPTCTEEGQQRRDCTRCDHFETESLPVLGHTEQILPAVEATCTEPGLTEGKSCTVCQTVLQSQETVEALGHDHVNFVCTRCGAYAEGSGAIGENMNWGVNTETGELTINGTGSLEVPEERPWAGYEDTVTDISIGEGITDIDPDLFDGLENLTDIIVSENNPSYADRDGVLFDKDVTHLIKYPAGREETEYTVPDSVTRIDGDAFSGNETLEKIHFTGDMPELPEDLFDGMTVTVTYPGANPTWDADNLPSGGNVTWEPVYDQPEVISLTADSMTLISGQTATVTAQLNFGDAPVIWTLGEGEEAYADMTAEGTTAAVTAKSVDREQTVTVTARTEGGVTFKQLQLTILPAVTGLRLLDQAGRDVTGTTVWYDTNSGDALAFTVEALPADAMTQITWRHTDPENAYAAYAAADGTFTVSAPTGKNGEITVTADDISGCGASVNVKFVSLKPETEPLPGEDPADLNLLSGKNRTLKVYDQQTDKALTAKQITWTMDPAYEPYATLTTAGKLTAKKVVKQVRIEVVGTITGSESTKVILSVDIFPAVTQLELWDAESMVNNKTVSFDLSGDTQKTIQACVFPMDAMGVPVKWTISDSKGQYAQYTEDKENNTLTIHTPTNEQGTVTIKATAQDGSNKSATVKVKFCILADSVTIGVKDVKTPVDTWELDGGKSVQLTSTVKSVFQGVNPTDTKVTWSLENPADKDYVALSTSGKVTAKDVSETRTVTLRATAKDSSGATDTFQVTVHPKNKGMLTILRDKENVTKTTVSVDLNKNDRTVVLYAHTFGMADPESVTWTPATSKIANIKPLADGGVEVQMVSAGSVTMKATAKDGSKRTATVTLKALRLADGVVISQKKTGLTTGLEVASGKSIDLQAVVNGTTSQKVTWAVDVDASVATVSSSGKVTAAKDLTMAHDVTVTATAADGSKASGTLTLTVRPIAQGVQVHTVENGRRTFSARTHNFWERSNTTLEWDIPSRGETVVLRADVFPFYTGDVRRNAIQAVTWKSSATKVADFRRDDSGQILVENGNVYLQIKATGSTTITVTAADGSNQKVTFKLNAVRNVHDITLEPQVLASGKSLNLAKLITVNGGAGTTTKKFTWTVVRGGDFASVNASGTLKAKTVTAHQQVTVRVTAVDSGPYDRERVTGPISREFTIDLYPATKKVQLSNGQINVTTLTLSTGESMRVYPSCQPVDAAGKYTWKSSNTKLVTVDSTGLITVLGVKGSATITCTAADGTGASAKVTVKIG